VPRPAATPAPALLQEASHSVKPGESGFNGALLGDGRRRYDCSRLLYARMLEQNSE
jgi:hypothetical protein